MRRLAFLVAVMTSAFVATAQQIYLSDWRTISSTKDIRDVDIDNDATIWAATSGGVQRTWMQKDRSEKYDNVSGLNILECTAIYSDKRTGQTYVGQLDGSIDIYDATSAHWQNIGDVQRATQYPKRAILDFAQRGDTIAIATEFGIVTLNTRSRLFIETIDRIGPFPEKSAVKAVSFIDRAIWILINGSVASASLDVPTLRLPATWTIAGPLQGLPDSTEPVIHLATNGTSLAVATARGVYRWVQGKFERVQTVDQDINGLSIDENGSIIISTSRELMVDGVPIQLQRALPEKLKGHKLVRSAVTGSTLVVFADDIGIGWVNNRTWESRYDLNTPNSNQFTDLSIDAKGWIWAATHTKGGYGGQGVNYYDGTTWRSITSSSQPLLLSNGCYRVSSLADGSTWIGTWGRGALRATHTNSGIEYAAFTGANSSLTGISADSNYILVSDAAIDRYGRTILLNEQSADRLFTVAEAGTWSYRQNCSNPSENKFRSLVVDYNGTVWCGSPESQGLIGYNDKNTDRTDDDICNRILMSNSQLQDNVVNALAVDQNGAIWIGTAKGLAVISSPGNLSNSSIPFVRRVSAMSTTYINDVFVDALNYKWIATPNGVFVLDESGIEVLATITSTTSPLLDNDVRAITVDPSTGNAYFGTLKGCSVARTSSMRPLPVFDVSCFPQPFRAGSDEQLVIDGLAPDSEVRIMSANGILVAAIAARGRQALWDGRDVYGNYVAPGVYLASVSSGSTSSSTVVKIAITR